MYIFDTEAFLADSGGRLQIGPTGELIGLMRSHMNV